eukprot:6256700-Pyramimonas_sp.AAC.1
MLLTCTPRGPVSRIRNPNSTKIVTMYDHRRRDGHNTADKARRGGVIIKMIWGGMIGRGEDYLVRTPA